MKTSAHFSLPILAGIALCTAPLDSKAQTFDENTNTISAGYGFVTLLGTISESFNSYNDLKYSSLGPIYLKFEHAISDKVGMGLNLAYATNKWEYRYDESSTSTNGTTTTNQYTETTDRSTYSILVRMNFHFGESDKFDPYAGFGVGYRNAKWTEKSTSPNGTSGVELKTSVPFGFEMTIGARYYFAEHFGVYLETGLAKSVVQAGLVVKL